MAATCTDIPLERVEVPAVMGSDLVVLAAPAGVAGQLVDLVQHLEQTWTRFSPSSELSLLSQASPGVMVCSTETVDLVDRMCWAYRHTGGLFDATVAAQLREWGYDRDFSQLTACGDSPDIPRACRAGVAPGMGGVRVDRATSTVIVDVPVEFDPGGLGKGLAADLAVAAALDAGATSVLVSVGGDLRVGGEAPVGGWPAVVDHPGVEPFELAVTSGALACSSTLRRRWVGPAGAVHHVVDPRTGAPAASGVASVSVRAPEAWLAEVAATVVLVDGRLPAGDWPGVSALVSFVDGDRRVIGDPSMWPPGVSG